MNQHSCIFPVAMAYANHKKSGWQDAEEITNDVAVNHTILSNDHRPIRASPP